MFKQNKVYLDFSNIPLKDLENDSPYLYRLYKKGYRGEWEMRPVQHYCMGGIKTDTWGRTNIPCLYACGECTGGLHGANRLGGGSLTETLVFGKRSGPMAARESWRERPGGEKTEQWRREACDSSVNEQEVIQKVKDVMWRKVGIERSTRSLETAKEELDSIVRQLEKAKGVTALMLHDTVRSAWSAVFAASVRKESRGAHILQDVPKEKSEWEGKLLIRKESIQFVPVNRPG